MKIKIEDGTHSAYVEVSCHDAESVVLNPQQAMKLSLMLRQRAETVCQHSRTDSGADSDGPYTICLQCGKQLV